MLLANLYFTVDSNLLFYSKDLDLLFLTVFTYADSNWRSVQIDQDIHSNKWYQVFHII